MARKNTEISGIIFLGRLKPIFIDDDSLVGPLNWGFPIVSFLPMGQLVIGCHWRREEMESF